MKNKHDKLQLRKLGKGFILNQVEGMIGRILTQTFKDQYERTYVKINGKFTPLLEQHSFLAAD